MTSLAEPLVKTGFTLTDDQQAALNAIERFLLDPIEQAFVLSGYSGCGKSTLIATVLDRFPKIQQTMRLIDPNYREYQLALTATTNKAAENLGQLSGMQVETIHAFLGLRVNTDFRTGETTLVSKKGFQYPEGFVIFIDESSYIDKEMLSMIFQRTKNCKVVFIGDPAQLTPVKATSTPAFVAGFPEAHLSQVVRQAKGNPIIELATKFRHTVNTGEFFGFTPDGHHIQRLDRDTFNAAAVAEFTRPDWKYQDSKILAWTNKRVVEYNQFIKERLQGDPNFQAGDYAVCNSFVTSPGGVSIKNDQLVHITSIEPDCQVHGVPGNWVTLNYTGSIFAPKHLTARNARLKQARAANEYNICREIECNWIDLRGAYACTINKAQGSTFNSVYIDLDDIGRCNSGDQIARMLYVAVSRARNHVYLTGDLA